MSFKSAVFTLVCAFATAHATYVEHKGVRDATFFFNATQTVHKKVSVEFNPEVCKDFLYFVCPKSSDPTITFDMSTSNGKELLDYSNYDNGIFQLVIPGSMVDVQFPESVAYVFSPRKGGPSFKLPSATPEEDRTFYFKLRKIGENTLGFRTYSPMAYDCYVKITEYVTGDPKVQYHNCHGSPIFWFIHREISLDNEDPERVWSITIPDGVTIGFWLEDDSNYFTKDRNGHFFPELPKKTVDVMVNANEKVGKYAPVYSTSPIRDDVHKKYSEFLDINEISGFCNQGFVESENEDDDPDHIEWFDEESNFADENHLKKLWNRELGHIKQLKASVLYSMNAAERNGREEWPSIPSVEGTSEFAEYVAATGKYIDYMFGNDNRKDIRLVVLNEPFGPYTSFGKEDYVPILEAVAQRLEKEETFSGQNLLERVTLLGPMIKVIRQAHDSETGLVRDPKKTFEYYEYIYENTDPKYCDGIVWDQWNIANLYDTHIFRSNVEKAAKIIDSSPNNENDEIHIAQYNTGGGGNVTPLVTNTFDQSMIDISMGIQGGRTGRLKTLGKWSFVAEPYFNKGLIRPDYNPEGDWKWIINPCGYAFRFFNESVLSKVVFSSDPNREFDQLATVDDLAGDRMNILAVNKVKRKYEVTITIKNFPDGINPQNYALQVLKMNRENPEKPVKVDENSGFTRVNCGGERCIKLDVESEAIYSLCFADSEETAKWIKADTYDVKDGDFTKVSAQHREMFWNYLNPDVYEFHGHFRDRHTDARAWLEARKNDDSHDEGDPTAEDLANLLQLLNKAQSYYMGSMIPESESKLLSAESLIRSFDSGWDVYESYFNQ